MTENRLPPNNIEAEDAILGSILLDPGTIHNVANILPADAFHISAHQQIYKAALELYHNNQPTDLLAVSTWLENHKLLKK